MSTRRTLAAGALSLALAVWPRAAHATVTVTPTASCDGSYTVSWTDKPLDEEHEVRLLSSYNGGAWTTFVPLWGATSRAYSGMAMGTRTRSRSGGTFRNSTVGA